MDEYIPFALTVEPPWKNNTPFISCIPAGRYLCKRYHSPQYEHTFIISNVLGRTYCLFHWGNWGGPHGGKEIGDTQGCVVVGEEFGMLDGVPALLSSKRGFREFLERTKGIDEFHLDIKDYC